LFDLAKDGFVNAKSRVLRRLVERGLVVHNPRLLPMNKSFREFILETGLHEGVPTLQKEGWSPSPVIRGTLVAVAIGVALIVFLTQRELLNLSTTFIGAVSAGTPALFKLFGLVRGGRTNE
jgi:hypothetical protein